MVEESGNVVWWEVLHCGVWPLWELGGWGACRRFVSAFWLHELSALFCQPRLICTVLSALFSLHYFICTILFAIICPRYFVCNTLSAMLCRQQLSAVFCPQQFICNVFVYNSLSAMFCRQQCFFTILSAILIVMFARRVAHHFNCTYFGLSSSGSQRKYCLMSCGLQWRCGLLRMSIKIYLLRVSLMSVLLLTCTSSKIRAPRIV